jgi:hydrogenase maturation protease
VRKTLIIGYGNPLRSDDGVGRRAAEALFEEWPEDAVRVESVSQLTVEMAEEASRCNLAVFIDADWGAVPGRIHSHRVQPETASTASLTHHLTPSVLLAIAQQLYGRIPEAVLVSMGGGSFDHGEGLSPSVEAAFPDLVAHVKKLVEKRTMTGESSKVKIHA